MGPDVNRGVYLAPTEQDNTALTISLVQKLAAQCGFELSGVVRVGTEPDFPRFRDWADRGLAGEMRYLTDHRGDLRATAENLLPGAKSVVSVGVVYNGPQPYSTHFSHAECGWIARYAWGDDYHQVIRHRLGQLAQYIGQRFPDFGWRACVDTAPLLERSLAARAGLGWIGKNTCLISQEHGSWFFLGELITTLPCEGDEAPAPDRCGTCTRCIEACPTGALVSSPGGRYELDSRLCISYFTIEKRGPIPERERASIGRHVFGCDICQDVCPWNSPSRAALTSETAFSPAHFAPPLARLAELGPEEFRGMFRHTAVSHAKYAGFLRNVAIAMGNSGQQKFEAPLRQLADSDDSTVSEAACWALERLQSGTASA